VFYSAGMMLSPLLLGWIFDWTDSYAASLYTLAILYGASAMFFAISRQPQATRSSGAVPKSN
jgi:MFS-type transporter involved in bile tolerance (Atg22 family)